MVSGEKPLAGRAEVEAFANDGLLGWEMNQMNTEVHRGQRGEVAWKQTWQDRLPRRVSPVAPPELAQAASFIQLQA